MASNPLSLVSILILIFSTTFALPSSPASTKFIQDDDTTVWTRSEGNGTALAGVTASSLELRGSTFFNCDGSKYRSNLNLASCKDAVDRIPASSGHESYALRGIGQYDVALPSRYISYDGLCTVDVLLKDEASSDRASKQEIKGAALGLLNRCVETQRVGGIAMDIGESRNLGIIMTSYVPTVKCYTPPSPPLGNCRRLADTMMTSLQRKTFGPATDQQAYVKLPKALYDDGFQCKAVIGTSGGTDVSTFYEIWEAIVAITGMCIRFGHAGTAFLIGEKNKLFVSLIQHLQAADETS